MNAKKIVITALLVGAGLIGFSSYSDGNFGATHAVGSYSDGNFGATHTVAFANDDPHGATYYQPVY